MRKKLSQIYSYKKVLVMLIMERILFVIPPHLKFADFIKPSYNARHEVRESGQTFGAVLTDMPLGPLSISAYLKKMSQPDPPKIKVLDFNVELNLLQEWTWNEESFEPFFEDVLSDGTDRKSGALWREFSPTIIGTSVLFGPSYDNLLILQKVFRKLFPSALLLCGGGIATTCYQKIFNDSPFLDGIGFAESEIPFLKLIEANDKLLHIKKDPAWISRCQQDEPSFHFKTDYIWDLDEIPMYDYALVDKNEYALNPALTAYAGVYEKANNFHYMTSRGCPYRCNFCASHKINGRKMRFHSIQRVKEDLQSLRDVYGAKTIVIQDDNFMGQGGEGKQRALEIVKAIGALKLNVVFQNSLTLISVTRELLEEMKIAGVTQLLLSVESGSEKSLRRMHKPLRLADITRVAEDCRDLGIYTDCNVLIGNIFENETDIEESVNFLRSGKCPADWFKIFITTPLPGSELYDQAVAQGLINGDVINFDFKKANLDRQELTAERLEYLQYKINLELNFVKNTNFQIAEKKLKKSGLKSAKYNYRLALQGFLAAIKAKDNHLFGHYYTALAYNRLGLQKKAEYHKNIALKVSHDIFWSGWLKDFPEVHSQIEQLRKGQWIQ